MRLFTQDSLGLQAKDANLRHRRLARPLSLRGPTCLADDAAQDSEGQQDSEAMLLGGPEPLLSEGQLFPYEEQVSNRIRIRWQMLTPLLGDRRCRREQNANLHTNVQNPWGFERILAKCANLR